jgi:hypothetical protein
LFFFGWWLVRWIVYASGRLMLIGNCLRRIWRAGVGMWVRVWVRVLREGLLTLVGVSSLRFGIILAQLTSLRSSCSHIDIDNALSAL